jgi:hypothetical protein
MRMRTLLGGIGVVGALVVGSSRPAGGQGPVRPPKVSVRGLVFDSVGGRPLRDAFVMIVGGTQSTTTDARGRFRFDSVPGGAQTFAVQHALLDSLGFSGLTKRTTIGGENDEVRVSVPSFATLWKSVCGSAHVPRDSGLIYGTIREANGGKPVAGAAIELSWSELAVRKNRKQVVDRRWKSETKATSNGDYAVCGVPLDAGMLVRAATDSSASGAVEIPLTGLRVQRRDLLVGATKGGAASRTGVVVGMLTDPSGAPFPDARVILDSQEVRSDFDGRFVLPGVATGSRQLEVLFIGVTPVLSTVDVRPGDTTMISLALPRITSLATVHVTSTERARMLREEFEERKIMYGRNIIDSTAINRLMSLPNVFYGIPNVTAKRSANGDFTVLMADGRGKSCIPELRVDGAMVNDFATLNSLPPNRVLAVEVYPHAFNVPSEYQRGGVRYQCGLVAVWTKWAMRLP